jgi:hypothetical protein
MYGFHEVLIRLSNICVLYEGLPELAGIDVNVATCVLLLIGFVSNTGAVEGKIKIGEVAAELARLFGIEFRRGTVTSSGHRDRSRHSVVWRRRE